MPLSDAERSELESYLSAEVAGDSRLGAWLAGAQFRVGRHYFGKAYVYALSLMVMHKAAMADIAESGASGPVTSKREGDLSVSFGTAQSSDGSDLSASVFGREYLSLLEQYSPRPGVTGGLRFGRADGGDAVQSAF